MTRLVFLDTETTSLDADTGEIWEVGAIVRTVEHDTDGDQPVTIARGEEHHWLLPVTLEHANPQSLDIGRFHERHDQGNGTTGSLDRVDTFAQRFARLTHRAHLVGNVISFDEERLRKLLRRHGVMPSWHYHLIDCEALAAGYLAGLRAAAEIPDPRWIDPTPPWNSRDLSEALRVEPPSDDERHTALGDARWAMRMYDAVMSGGAA